MGEWLNHGTLVPWKTTQWLKKTNNKQTDDTHNLDEHQGNNTAWKKKPVSEGCIMYNST